MSYKDIRVPFLEPKTIRRKADLFKKKYWNNSIPIDIERIIDLKMELFIITTPNLRSFCYTDALISSNWKWIYVDKYKYLNENPPHRLRFSLAHEIGHFILHKDLYDGFNINTPQDFYKTIERIPEVQYRYLESQANKFANFLLVPREELIIIKDKELKKIKKDYKEELKGIEEKKFLSYLAIPISEHFCVSNQVAEIALDCLNRDD